MLTVAPRGSVKAQDFFESLAFFSTVSIVKGRVPEELAVENAVNSTGIMAR